MRKEIKQIFEDRNLIENLGRFLVQSSPDGVFMLDQNGIIQRSNESACTLLGYTYEEFDELPLNKIHEKNFDVQFYLETGENKPRTFEAVYTCKNGKTIPVSVSITFLKLKEAKIAVVFFRDITERVERENELEKLKSQLKAENIYLQEEIKVEHNFGDMIGESNSFKKVLNKIEQVADTDANVLILGESGTGKELIARALHNFSSRKEKPLVKVNCSALPANLIESELFGREKGAFTGALTKEIGRFELADKGTIFLDEIGDLPLELQPKLLRVLQEGEFERVGSPKTIKVDVRVIAATNRDLEQMVKEDKFREDLYYRLNVFPITSPPLRDRKSDLPTLVKYFVNKHSAKFKKQIDLIPNVVMESFMNYSWPGNIRELENIIERAIILSRNNKLVVTGLIKPDSVNNDSELKPFIEIEKEYLLKVLESTSWKISGPNGAAEILGIKASTLNSRLKKLGIEKQVNFQ